jgi:Ca2+-binding RTX toxin-like protein
MINTLNKHIFAIFMTVSTILLQGCGASGVGRVSETVSIVTGSEVDAFSDTPVITPLTSGTNTSQTIAGSSEAGASVEIFQDGISITTVTADGSGNWTYTTAGLSDATYAFTAQGTDSFKNLSSVSSAESVTIDTVSVTPGVASFGTLSTTPTITGTAEADAAITISVDGVAFVTTTDSVGAFSFDITGVLSVGQHSVVVIAQDAYGNISLPSKTGIIVGSAEYTLGAVNNTATYGAVNVIVYGQGGNDTITTGAVDSFIDGGAGNDTITGGVSNDIILGGTGADTLTGGTGEGYLYGGDGADTITGGTGADIIYGDAGDDTITAGTGDDTIYGGDGNDTITAGTGDDTIDGGAGNDSLTGSAGNDTYITGTGDDSITDSDGSNDITIDGEGIKLISLGAYDSTILINNTASISTIGTSTGYGQLNLTGNIRDYSISYASGAGEFTITGLGTELEEVMVVGTDEFHFNDFSFFDEDLILGVDGGGSFSFDDFLIRADEALHSDWDGY